MRWSVIPVLVLAGACLWAGRPDLGAARERLERLTSLPLVSPRIVVRKAARRLELHAGGKLLKSYPVALGHRGLADKVRQGDHLTPEGRFYVCSQNEWSRFHLFLGLSYPNEAAVARGLKTGLLSQGQHDAILRSLRAKACPDWNTRLGGTVGIHGGGIGMDWTWGCIALANDDIEEVWLASPAGTPVEIVP